MPATKYVMRMSVPSVDAFGNDLARALSKVLTEHGPEIVFQTCGSCKHMKEDGPAFCTKYNMTPPCSVILSGCPAHDDKEDIPF